MNGRNLESLVRGIRVASDVAVTVQVGSDPAVQRTDRQSHTRRLSLKLRHTGNQPGQRRFAVDWFDPSAAIRAGRSGSFRGVLVSRGLALIARQTVLSGRSIAVGGFRPTADGCFDILMSKRPAAAGNDLPGCLRQRRFNERPQSKPAWYRPVMRTSTASARGTEDR
jgi:hypothetical protein